ncbi:MAG: AAA family ATPase [Leptolyngbyaceae cyanobacterium RM2_2_4]|nr:AAA family ATPase [Leptolyngbyaceae cyanobacterium RM2_2_4]
MSDLKDDFNKNMKKVAELEALKTDTAAKKAVLDNKRVSSQLEQVEQNERDMAIARNTNYGALTQEQILDIQKNNDEYMEAAKFAMTFIIPKFDNLVPFFRKNFILVGARTGEGKSTAVANIAFTTMQEKNKATGKLRRVLVLTNEERAEDFYNRITSLINGWHYTNHSKFTQQQRDMFHKMIPLLAAGGRLTVIDNNHNGSHGVTTSIEGIATVFDNLIANQEYYDVILIDYYQNIIHSQKYPHWSENEVQAKLSRMMDKYKNAYPAPIVMMAQINPPDKDDKIPFQHRIKGRKIIMDPATFAVEMIRDTKLQMTKWVIHKSRFTEAIGQDLKTGYDKGKFVEYTSAFATKVQTAAYEREARKLNQQIDQNNGLPDVFKKDEEKKEEPK